MEGALARLIRLLAERPEDGPPRVIGESTLRREVLAALAEIRDRLDRREGR